jgi:hypothetical protein
MPLVISAKSQSVHYVRSEEILGEILGHSDFDGQKWAIGDVVVFEDGTGAHIEQYREAHTWGNRTPMEVVAAVAAVQKFGDSRLPPESDVPTFDRLFFLMAQPLPGNSWWRHLLEWIYVLLFIGLVCSAVRWAFSK